MPKIEMTKQYRTRDGRPVRVLCVDRVSLSGRPVLALVKHSDGTETVFDYTADGEFLLVSHHDQSDLIEATPYDGLKVDDLVMVRDCDKDDWEPHRFAGVGKNGHPMVWSYGRCSFTAKAEDAAGSYGQCRPATEAEIAAAREKNLRALRGE